MASDDDALASVTLARLLADHGDVRRARRVLADVLRRTPGDPAAQSLRRTLETARQARARDRADDGTLPRLSARADELASRFRNTLNAAPAVRQTPRGRRPAIERLERWLRAMRRHPPNDAPCPSRGAGARLDRRPDGGGTS